MPEFSASFISDDDFVVAIDVNVHDDVDVTVGTVIGITIGTSVGVNFGAVAGACAHDDA